MLFVLKLYISNITPYSTPGSHLGRLKDIYARQGEVREVPSTHDADRPAAQLPLPRDAEDDQCDG